MIRNLVLGAAASVAALTIASGAFAADLPAYEPAPAVTAVPSFTWTGPYVGVQAGYSFGDTNIGRNKPKGAVVGGFAGYNVQLDNSPLVLGVETDFNYADIDDNKSGARTKTRWDGATRGRIGYAFDRVLFYGAGGVAYAKRQVNTGAGSDKKNALGYTAGGGVEYAATDNVIARVDYRYADYGKDNFSGAGKSSYTEHRVMGGVAYKFGF